MIIGIDIGGTNFRIGGLDENNNIVNFKKVKVNDVLKSEDVLLDIKNMILENFDIKAIEAISIGIPGTIDLQRKKIIQVPNVKGMNNLDIVEYLNLQFNVPIFIERDVNMLIQYDLDKYHIDTKGIVIGVYYGTGIGNSILINGNVLIGKDGAAGEIGHIPVDNCMQECGCGNIGCIEAVAGGKYLAKLCESKFPDCHISEVFVSHSDDEQIKEFVDRMSQAICSEINILNPDEVIVGGGIINMNCFPLEYFKECINKHTRKPLPLNNLNIIFVDDNEQKGTIGACLFAKRKLNIYQYR